MASIFSESEVQYIKSQHLARIATASTSADGFIQPDVVPVGFDFDGEYIYVGGMNILRSTKYRNVLKNDKVAIIIDDLKSTNPWEPRGVRVYGTADSVSRSSGYMSQTDHPSATYIRIKPLRKWSWGIDGPVFQQGKFNVKKASA